ncbi:MAG: cupredoxin domain-containing protein, partial [Actinomycetota bacterium]
MSATTVKPGDITFQVTNAGNVAHNFAILKLKLRTEMLNPGQSVTIVASNVAEGSYEVLCEVSGHPEAGMKTTLTVSSDAPSADQAMMAGDGGIGTMTWQQMDAKM